MTAALSHRRLDHLVLPARDLDAQAAFYQRLGFTVGARNVHPWGTENRLVQFDGCFLELITLGTTATPPDHAARRFSFGAHVRHWLQAEGDGMSMLCCSSLDAKADAQWFAQAGVAEFEPFHFGRKGKRPDGSDTEVAFTLAFTTPSFAGDLCFFVCQQHFPEDFWNPSFQRHDNTATGVSRVVVVADDPAESVAFQKSYLGGEPVFSDGVVATKTQRGTLSVMTPAAARADLGDDPALFDGRRSRFGAIIFDVARIDATELSLRKNNVPHRREHGRIVVPSGAAFGVLVVFEQRTA
jgi:catechol 2,3-dioxygenase-like lactoylglutathione lyase family enzyme